MIINFGVQIFLDGDYGSNSGFGLSVIDGKSTFKWSIGALDGWKKGILSAEWCSGISNSVSVDDGGGIASHGAFTITIGNGSQQNKFFDTLPLQGAVIKIFELPSKRIYTGRIDGYSWDQRILSLYIESLDATADLSLSVIEGEEQVPIQFGALKYGAGQLVVDTDEDVAVPGLSHASSSCIVFVLRSEYIELILDLYPIDWAAAVAYLQPLVGNGLCVRLRDQSRVVSTLISVADGRVRITSDTGFVNNPDSTDGEYASLFISVREYAFDSWALDIGDDAYVVADGEMTPISISGSFEAIGSNRLRIRPDAVLDDKMLSATYAKSFIDDFSIPSITAFIMPTDTSSLVHSPSGGGHALSDGSLSDTYEYSYAKGASIPYFVNASADKGTFTLAIKNDADVSFTIPIGQAIRIVSATSYQVAVASETVTATRHTSGNHYYVTIPLKFALQQDVVFAEIVALDSSYEIKILTHDVYTTKPKGKVFLAMDFDVEALVSGAFPRADVVITGVGWGAGAGVGTRSTLLSSTLMQFDDTQQITTCKNLPQSFGESNSIVAYDTDPLHIYQGGRGYEQSVIAKNWKDILLYSQIIIKIIPYATPTKLLRIRFREFGFGILNSSSIPSVLYASLGGRSDGLYAKTTYSNKISTAAKISRHIRQLMVRDGDAPAGGWGSNYGSGSTIAYNISRAGEGGYDDPDILQWGFSQNAASASIMDAGALDMLSGLMRENFVINWRDSFGMDGVTQLIRSYNNPVTKIITLKSVTPQTIFVEDFGRSSVYCNPAISWGKMPNGKFEGQVAIRNSELDISDEATQASNVLGTLLDQSGRALLWRRARALYVYYRTITPLDGDASVLEWCRDKATATWYLDTLLSWMGANQNGIVSPRKKIKFSMPYEDATDQTGRKFDVGSRFIFNTPHETDGYDWECVCVAVEHDIVGLETSVEAVGFKASDWPSDVEPISYVQDTSENNIWIDNFNLANQKVDL